MKNINIYKFLSDLVLGTYRYIDNYIHILLRFINVSSFLKERGAGVRFDGPSNQRIDVGGPVLEMLMCL